MLFVGASNTSNLLEQGLIEQNDHHMISGVSGLSLHNKDPEKNVFHLLRGRNTPVVLNHDVINNSITDYTPKKGKNRGKTLKGLEEEEFWALMPSVKELGVVAIVMHPRNDGPKFVNNKEDKLRQWFVTIDISRALGNSWRQFCKNKGNSVENIHLPACLERRFTQQVIQCASIENLMQINKIKHKNRKPGRGSRAKNNYW